MAAAVGPISFTSVGAGWVGYRTIGELGPAPLLFVPTAAGMNLDVLLEYAPCRRFFERIAEFGGVILFDRRGTGVSDEVPDRIAPTLEDWTEDALAVLTAVEVDRVTLLAHGMGTPPALLFAAGHPDRVQSIVTLNGFARFTAASGYPAGAPEEVIEQVVQVVADGWGEGSVYFLASPGLRDDPEVREWVARQERNTFGRAAAMRAWRSWLSIDVRDVLPSVRAPALVMHGASGAATQASRWLARELPRADIVEFTNDNFDWWYLEGQHVAVEAIGQFTTGGRPSPRSERVLATVLFTDIVDSTGRAAAVGDERWRSLLDRHDRISASVVEDYRGRLVKQTGDGVLATFDGPARAVECARHLADSLAGAGIAVRSGLHAGEIELRDGDVAGIAVHIAARVAACAEAGEVLVSRTIPDLVVGAGLTFDPRGACRLKGIDGEWDIFALS